ncbi:MAG TPA: class I SAM-dependent methyltransferase [Abditibacteriaceae bacterium]|jgi:2-polyprenyl-3-methyl-5-hydroxy-6-metoxy-1,4-benzoquinol methylase
MNTAQHKQAQRVCPVCEDFRVEALHHQDFVLPEAHPLAAGYDVVACLKCGFVYADTLIGQAEYDLFYEAYSKYDDVQTSTGGGGTAHDAERLAATAADLAAFLNNPAARILDIGCATGGLLHELKKRGYHNLCGLDPSPAAARFGRENFGLEMQVGTLSQHSLEGQFDCVLLSHVLEHVQDLRASMSEIRALMKNSGVLYVEVPDAARYAECIIAPFQDFNTEHINHFGRASLAALVGQFGFTPKHMAQKTIEAAPGLPYPALYGFWMATEDAERIEFERDEQFLESIRLYIRHSREMLNEIDARLGAALETMPQIDVWGAGQLTLKLLGETVLGKANIRHFIDGNPINHGKTLFGRTVISPQQWVENPLPVVIASTIHQDAIVGKIRDELKVDVPLITLRASTRAESKL